MVFTFRSVHSFSLSGEIILNCTSFAKMELDDLNVILETHDYQIDIRDEQFECLQHLEKGENVFAQLPTGYGKSLIYTLYPLYMEKVRMILKTDTHACTQTQS